MRKFYVCIMLLFSCVLMNAQSKNNQYSFKENQVDTFIKEVYQDQAQKVVYSNAAWYKSLKKLIVERLKIVKQAPVQGKKYPKLTEMGMLDTYNQSLKHDPVFNKNTFNPLKYNLEYFARSLKVYRIDNTDYLLMILPQTNPQN